MRYVVPVLLALTLLGCSPPDESKGPVVTNLTSSGPSKSPIAGTCWIIDSSDKEPWEVSPITRIEEVGKHKLRYSFWSDRFGEWPDGRPYFTDYIESFFRFRVQVPCPGVKN